MGDGSSEHPGSYAKSLGPRRKRKGKGERSSLPPLSTTPPAVGQALDTQGEEVIEGGRLERTTLPDWGEGAQERPHAVDDLRKRPSSNHAARKPLGPLGMEEPASEAITAAPRRASTPQPTGRLNVVEINASERAAREAYDDRYEPSADPFGDPFADQAIGSNPPAAHVSEQPVAYRAPEAPRAPRPSDMPRAQRPSQMPRPSRRPSASSALVLDEDRDDEDLINQGRPSLSSVFDARASLRPSPPPPKRTSSALGWWIVVTLLTGIIVAAGWTAYRESQQGGPRASAPSEQAPPTQEPAGLAPPQPAQPTGAHEVTPSTPVATPKAVTAPVVTPRATPVATHPAIVAPKPVVAPKVVTTPKPRPVVTQLHDSAPRAAQPAELARPVEWQEDPPRPAEHPRVRLQHAAETSNVVQTPAITPPPAPATEPAPPADERLPQNPYR